MKLLRQLRALHDETPSLSLLRQLRHLFLQLRHFPAEIHSPAIKPSSLPQPAQSRGNDTITIRFTADETPAECVCTWDDARHRDTIPSFHFAVSGFVCRCEQCVGGNEDPRETLLALLHVVAGFGGSEWLASGDGGNEDAN